MALTHTQFIDKYSGKKIDFDGAYGGQCVDLFRQYCKEVLGMTQQPKGVVGAADFWTNYATDPVLSTNFTQIKNTDDFKPLAGDIMVWNRKVGRYIDSNGKVKYAGHIGVVSDNNATLTSFNSFDQNWRALSVCEITKHTYDNVYGVFRFKKEPMPDGYGDVVWKSTQHDKTVASLFESGKDPRQTTSEDVLAVVNGYRSQATDSRNKLATAEQEVTNRVEQVGRLNTQLTEQVETYEARLSALKTDAKAIEKLEQSFLGQIAVLNARVDETSKEKGKALLRVSVLEAENKDLKDRLTAPLSIAEVVAILIKKLLGK